VAGPSCNRKKKRRGGRVGSRERESSRIWGEVLGRRLKKTKLGIKEFSNQPDGRRLDGEGEGKSEKKRKTYSKTKKNVPARRCGARGEWGGILKLWKSTTR